MIRPKRLSFRGQALLYFVLFCSAFFSLCAYFSSAQKVYSVRQYGSGSPETVGEAPMMAATGAQAAAASPTPISAKSIRPNSTPRPEDYQYSRTLVVARTSWEDVSWIEQELPQVDTAIYTVNDPFANLTVPANKGHEAMVYLTYIIDNYDSLPDVVLFFHAHRRGWHNNELLDKDAVEMITRLSSEWVTRVGYMPARCPLTHGCPNWIHLDKTEEANQDRPEAAVFTTDLWGQLFPGETVPATLSEPDGAQFAVSRNTIRAAPKARFEHLRNWLINTNLHDYFSGRVFEYTWQYIFTGKAEFCPSENSCYCGGYGVCFGSDAKLKRYSDRALARNESWWKWHELDMEVNAGDEGKRSALDIALREVLDLDQWLEERKAGALARGKDPAIRILAEEVS